MTKARRAMQEDIKLVDLVIELLDARVPRSSGNPDIDTLAKNKFRLVLLNKADLADPNAVNAWIRYYADKGITAVALDSRTGTRMKEIQSKINEVCKEKIERDLKRGIQNRPIRAMVVGIPNVGKSTFINSLAGRAAAKTGNKPGVTKGNQWIRLNKSVELLDTPGILWPKFEDEEVGYHLAFIGSINDEVIVKEELCYRFVKFIQETNPEVLKARYEIMPDEDPNQTIEMIALKRNSLKKGGEADILKASTLIIDDFRSGKLGKISIEFPEQKVSSNGNKDQ